MGVRVRLEERVDSRKDLMGDTGTRANVKDVSR